MNKPCDVTDQLDRGGDVASTLPATISSNYTKVGAQGSIA